MNGGQQVREARLRAGLTQRRLAARVGLSQPGVARIESGITRPTLPQVQGLVEACGLELRWWLVPRDDSDWSVAQSNLRLDAEARVRQHQAALRFIRAGQEARAGREAAAGQEARARGEPAPHPEPARRREPRTRRQARARHVPQPPPSA
jgi:transcriptional regulator with XRE-family HTH domain